MFVQASDTLIVGIFPSNDSIESQRLERATTGVCDEVVEFIATRLQSIRDALEIVKTGLGVWKLIPFCWTRG